MLQSRQLAAIMFTDIVGYTALMGEDEEKAFELLKKNRQLQKPLIEQNNGRWIKELGDGVLASFTTVSDAVITAIRIQEACNLSKEFLLRIGIHHGEIVFENDDIFGDAVNIASRLQALAPVGAIWISESVQNNVSNKKDIKTKFVRSEILKNIKEPVRIYEVITNNNQTEQSKFISQKSTKPSLEKSIAVLPFVDMSSSHDQEYLGDGLAEEILSSIVHLKDLKVAGRTSSFQFKGARVDLREVGEKLGVGTVLEGSVRKQGNRLRVTAQLINVQDGFHIWNERYDRDMDDIFAIQDEIALAITERLKITLLEKDREKIVKTFTKNTEAYELYLKGRFHINRRGRAILTGLDFLKQAITLDPAYALAHSGYADALFLAAFYNFLPGKEVLPKVKQEAETAIKLDATLSEAYCSLGACHKDLTWDWAEAKTNFLKAIELNPQYAQAHSFYGFGLQWFEGNFAKAEKHGRIAIKLEPLSAIDHADLAWTLHAAGKFDEALAMAKTGIELDTHSFLSHRLAGLSYMASSRYEEAIDAFSHLINISNRHQHAVNGLIWAYCGNGNVEEARVLMNELEERSATEYIAGTYAGLSAAYLGDMNKAFYYLEQAYNDRDPNMVQIKHSRYVPPSLKNDPRFQNLLDRIGFPK